MTFRFVLALMGWTCVSIAAPVDVYAQSDADDARARQLFENGADLYNEGRYEEAIIAWDEAYRLSNRPKILFNIANAYERMGEIQKALDKLFTYKAFATAEQREQIERRIRALESRLQNTPEPKPDPVVPTPTPNPEPQPKPKPVKTGGGGPPAGGIVLLGAGVVGLGGGAAMGLISSGAKNTVSETCIDTPEGLFCSADVEGQLKTHRTTAVLADVGFVVGALATATGVVVLATGSGGKATVGVGPNRVQLNGRF